MKATATATLIATVLAGCGSGERTAEEQPTPAASATAATATKAPAAPERLWRDRGHRVVRLRARSEVGIYSRPGGRRVARARVRTEFGSPMSFGVLARRGEWLQVTTPLGPPNQPLWIRADAEKMRFPTTRYSIHVSLERRRLELRSGGQIIDAFPVAIGAPATSTPTGQFAVTDVIIGGLNPVYGCCALALSAHQPSLPQGWIGGDRVAIHGTDEPVGVATSNGCIRARDADLEDLARFAGLGTPVVIEG